MTTDVLTKHNVQILGNASSDKVLLFAHGFGSDQTSWRLVAPAFAADYRLVLFDLPGCGRSQADENETLHHTRLESYAQDILDICEALDLEEVQLVAHSVSSMTATLVALKHPNLITRLVFISASPRYIHDQDYVGSFDQATADEILAEMSQNYFQWVRKYAPSIMNTPKQPLLSAEFSKTLLRLRPDYAFLTFSLILKSDYRREVSQLKLPTLILQAENDPFVAKAVSEYLHQAIRSSQLHWIDAKGHFPQLSNPQAVIAALKDFLH
ncbi:alpha/beta fold hydrolase [Picosynechococcus sp. PCC 7117]|uniref:alpha/beta fold hydrolase n=1 Tax=Picosynechococcus sp. PCC 7117 TaxID=195498 RepID=UPI0009FEFD02|nr:alpha/beta hydrolase [Picosynechococcus sp. PCC 7117]